ncbi:MAG: tetratricopeptide repeat protein [Acidimicrobiales bacterium]
MTRADGAGWGDTGRGGEGRAPWVPEEIWVSDGPVGSEVAGEPEAGVVAGAAPGPPSPPRHRREASKLRDVATGREGLPSPGGRRRSVPSPVVDELAASAGPERGSKLGARLADAAYAYEKERYDDANRILRSLARQVPGSQAVRELYGLVLYRLGQWAQAARQLEAYRQMSGSFDQHPVLADCYRALRRYDDAAEIWEDLCAASPSGDLVAEGRIVAAGCLADRGDLIGAIRLLEVPRRRVSRPQERHLRQWYALADLHERAGDLPGAREMFARVAAAEPDAFDVRERLRALR